MQPKVNFAQISTCFLGMGFASLIAAPVVLAQPLPNPGAQGLEQTDLSNVLNGNGGTGTGSMMNLLNQIKMMDGRNPSEVAAEQSENLNSAAENFRRRQQLQLQSDPTSAPLPPSQPLQ